MILYCFFPTFVSGHRVKCFPRPVDVSISGPFDVDLALSTLLEDYFIKATYRDCNFELLYAVDLDCSERIC